MFEIKEVKNKRDLREFVNFPFDLYKPYKLWVPPLKSDEIKQLNPDTNPAFKSVEAKFWIARKNGKCAGRIGAIIQHDYNTKNKVKAGRFTRIEFIDDEEVSSALLRTAEEWLREKGMQKIHGPLGFNNLDNQGLLIEGFKYLPSVASVYHPPYYQKHIEKLGYKKENDWIEFRLTMGKAAQEKANRGAAMIRKRYGFEVVDFQTQKELMPYLHPVFEMFNHAFNDLHYVTPFSKEMIDYVGKKYFKVLNPKFVKVVKKDDQLVAFIVGVPSLSVAMQKANGKLFPLGFRHILKAMKEPEIIDLYLTGVEPAYHSAGVAVILFAELQKEMLAHGTDQMETTGIFEDNHPVISNWKNYDHIQHKRRRCFVKNL
ncbi:MAG: hypothetical protein KDC05_01720 [Bacteroidales bacterium]|nr:hypothetical protein [Bacteroidales bacterium]